MGEGGKYFLFVNHPLIHVGHIEVIPKPYGDQALNEVPLALLGSRLMSSRSLCPGSILY